MAVLRDLVARARSGRLCVSELTDAVAAVIFPPQVAFFGIGAPMRRPWVAVDGNAGAHRRPVGRSTRQRRMAPVAALQSPETL